jgi:ADP-heptose:LPS heptosyltransferase
MSDTVIYFKNGIGNLIMMTPAIQALAKMDKSRQVDVCLDSQWLDDRRHAVECILKELGSVFRTIHYPGSELDSYKTWFYTKHNTGSRAADLFTGKVDYEPLEPHWKHRLIHEVDFYMEHVYMLGYKGPVPTTYMPTADSGPVLHALKSPLLRPIIVLCNGALKLNYWEKKRWPHFAELAEALKAYTGGSIVLVGDEGELAGVPCDVDYTGKLSITETATVIGQANVIVTTDTANMHVADALRRPTVALFGPTLASKNGPRDHNSVIVKSDMECAPCQESDRFWSCTHYKCMEAITIGDAMHAVRALMKRTGCGVE